MLRWLATTVSAIWIVLSIIAEFFDVDPNQYGPVSADSMARMSSCQGNYHQRYACKEQVTLSKQRHSFLLWIGKVCIVFGPPAALFLMLRYAYKEQPAPENGYYQRPPPPVKRRRVR
jgi:hypothetical protein